MARILIVDDSVIMRRNLKNILTQAGHTIVGEASNGQHAFGEYEKHMPDLVTMDITMPVMDGIEAVTNIISKYHDAKIIMISALDQKSMVFEALERGAKHYVIKPITSDKVLTVVHEVLIGNNDLNNRNEMWVEIKGSKDQIVELSRNLEERVEERTKELTDTNRELKTALEQLKETQEQLLKSEKAGALAGMVAGIAHEINTPIGIGITAVSFLEQKTKELVNLYKSNTMKKSDFEKYLQINTETIAEISFNLSKASELIKSFKQVAVDQTSEQKRMFNLREYISQVITSMRPELRKSKINITVNCNKDININSYPGAFFEIINNLIMNSLNHAYEVDDVGNIVMNITKGDKNLAFEYSDDGKGIKKELLGKIFDPFFTTKRGRGGTGLGLNIVYNIVAKNLKGTIECESEEGKGTAFIINIPIEE